MGAFFLDCDSPRNKILNEITVGLLPVWFQAVAASSDQGSLLTPLLEFIFVNYAIKQRGPGLASYGRSDQPDDDHGGHAF
jgi:hypothetical protein